MTYTQLAHVLSCALLGIESTSVEVEVNIDFEAPEPSYTTVGLPDTAVRESKDRVKAAIINSGFNFYGKRIIVNLAPANVKKEGSAYDLPIAVGFVFASCDLNDDLLLDYAIVGELSLDGRVRPVRGVLSMAAMLAERGVRGFIVPLENATEAAIVQNIDIIPVTTLRETVDFLMGTRDIVPFTADPSFFFNTAHDGDLDFADVKGQEFVKRAVEIAAAGGHNVIMIGPPGSGKTMIAKRIPTILPEMSFEEALETTKIHSVCGTLDDHESFMTKRPFRAPHHTISDAGLIGGGTYPMPGDVSLAHNGVLFLDEILEFKRHVLEVLRQPLEDGVVTISRAMATMKFPARFMLIAAMNPCPCGYNNDPTRECTCTRLMIQRYLSRISGPLLDRIDIHVEVAAMSFRELATIEQGESSAAIRERINRAREIQKQRFKRKKIHSNSQMTSRDLKTYCPLPDDAVLIMEQAVDRLGLSARAFDRILKVARTIADIEGVEQLNAAHIAEAIQYRTLDKEYFGH